jgi:transposase
MWELPKGSRFLPGISVGKLESLYVNETRAKPKTRLLCALHRKKGRSIDQIAGITNTNRNTVHGWLRKFVERGITGKDSKKQSGRPPLLTEKQRRELVKDLEAGPKYNKSGLWSTKEVRDLLKRKYGITFVNQHVWRMLTSMGFTLQRPRKRHYMKASDAEIEAFKKSRGGRQGTTERKALSWAQKTRPRSA